MEKLSKLHASAYITWLSALIIIIAILQDLSFFVPWSTLSYSCIAFVVALIGGITFHYIDENTQTPLWKHIVYPIFGSLTLIAATAIGIFFNHCGII